MTDRRSLLPRSETVGKIITRDITVWKICHQQLETAKMSERQIPEMTADELRAISRKLTNYVDLRPSESDARSLAIRCGEIAALLEAQSAHFSPPRCTFSRFQRCGVQATLFDLPLEGWPLRLRSKVCRVIGGA